MTGNLTNLEKYFAFNLEFAENVFPVSSGLAIFNWLGEIFFIFLDIK